MKAEITLFTQTLEARANVWMSLSASDRKRKAIEAANTKDLNTLWGLVEAFISTYGDSGLGVSEHTLRAYKTGLNSFLAYVNTRAINPLQPKKQDGALFVRHLESQKASPSTIRVRIAAVKLLYKALRWAEATNAAPLDDVRPPKDKTEAWDKRQPYTNEEVNALLEIASPEDKVMILLGAHTGLRVFEATGLKWEDIEGDILIVKKGKGNKIGRVALSKTLKNALNQHTNTSEFVLGGIIPHTVRYRLKQLCKKAKVTYKGYHAFRHYVGTEIYRKTGSLEDSAGHLRHSDLSTTRVYAKWSNQRVAKLLSDW